MHPGYFIGYTETRLAFDIIEQVLKHRIQSSMFSIIYIINVKI